MADEPNIAELEARVKASEAAQLEAAIKFVKLGFGDDFGSPFCSLRFRAEQLKSTNTDGRPADRKRPEAGSRPLVAAC
jgi:hypothetical protein